jgi:hypothetical protein
MKFRKKPVVIDAFQWPSDDPPIWWRASLGIGDSTKLGNAREHDGLGGDKPHVLIKTLEGIMRADQGDWIILGVQGEIYPCKPDIFVATYEPA